jgi:hypothetical protein
LEKKAIKTGPKTASQRAMVIYTLTYRNSGDEPLDVRVMENYDQRMTFIEASLNSDPGTDNAWTFPKLKPGAYGQIKYTSTHRSMNTDLDGYVVTNSSTVYYGDSGFNKSGGA